MRRAVFALLIVGCAAPGDPSSKPGGGGGKADGESADAGLDAGVDAAPSVTLQGTCDVSTTHFQNGYGYRDSENDPIALETHIDGVGSDGSVVGTVHVASPWGSIPDGMWRAWCHIAHQDFQPLGNSCAIGPYDISTASLGFGQGYTSFRKSEAGYAMSISAFEEIGRDSYYDDDWTKVSFFCTLQ